MKSDFVQITVCPINRAKIFEADRLLASEQIVIDIEDKKPKSYEKSYRETEEKLRAALGYD